MPPPILETERLRLRPFALSDAAEVRRLAGDRAIADTTLNIPHPYEEGVAEAWIATHDESFTAGRAAQFAITRKSDGLLLGCISLMDISERHSHAEMGYWIGRPYWNRGFCTEAGHAAIQYAFEVIGLNRVHAHYFSRNPSSGRVMQKLGMQYEGNMRQHVKRWAAYENVEFYGILAADWRQTPDLP